MKYLWGILCMCLTVFLLTACATAPAIAPASTPTPTADPLLEAGDTFNGMRLIREQGNTPWLWDYCDSETAYESTTITRQCEVPLTSELFIGLGWVLDTWEEVEAGWLADSATWELFIDDQPVDLSTFGVNDFEASGLKFRMWNVVIENITPGAHTIRYIFVESGASYDATWEFIITEGAPD